MPHVLVTLWPGTTEAQTRRLADEIAQSVTSVIGDGPESVSVAFREVPASRWKAAAYTPDVVETDDALFKTPGYAM